MNASDPERTGMTSALTVSRCWDQLRGVSVGRLAVVVDGRPEIFPMNYVVDGTSVVFRTALGTKMDAAANGPVAFEADGFDQQLEEAWSVVIKGTAAEINDVDELVAAARLPLAPLNSAAKTRFLRVTAEEITGRQFPVVDPEFWRNPFTLHRRDPMDLD